MRLILARHGAAYAGLRGVVAGPRGCQGLTPNGRRQAEALRNRLADSRSLVADALLTSELPRAIETAGIIAPALGFDEAVRDCDLCEVHTGEADGTDWSEYASRFGPFDMEIEPDRAFAPGGDSWTSFHERVHRALRRLARDHEAQTVVAVTHAGVIMASIRTLFAIPHPGTGSRLLPTNTGLTVWDHDPERDRWDLRTFNDAAHLDAPLPLA